MEMVEGSPYANRIVLLALCPAFRISDCAVYGRVETGHCSFQQAKVGEGENLYNSTMTSGRSSGIGSEISMSSLSVEERTELSTSIFSLLESGRTTGKSIKRQFSLISVNKTVHVTLALRLSI